MQYAVPNKTYPLFSEEESEKAVIDRMGDAPNERLKEVMTSVVKHLHAVVKETEPTMDEWMAAIKFLTETGHMCDDWRQEFILLSDVLGVSMLVDAINNRKRAGATENTVLGPFHVADAPVYEMGTNICLDGKGDPLYVYGRVVDTNGNPISGARMDIWQANPEGFYDVQQKGIQPDHNLRGVFVTGEDGTFNFRTVRTLHYPIPDDGTVGNLIKQTGRHPIRPAHLHFLITANGFKPVTTHLFDSTCPWLYSDAVFGVKESLVAQVRAVNDESLAAERNMSTEHFEMHWEFVLDA